MISGEWGNVPTELIVWDPPHRLGTAMDQGTFAGSWSWELVEVPGGTLLVVTEAGEVRSPIFRAFMIFHDNAATMLAFHHALADRLAVQANPSVVED
jgi:hypothetical protein